MAPPRYSLFKFTKSYVIQVPASIINIFFWGYKETAAAARAILSIPKVVGVL